MASTENPKSAQIKMLTRVGVMQSFSFFEGIKWSFNDSPRRNSLMQEKTLINGFCQLGFWKIRLTTIFSIGVCQDCCVAVPKIAICFLLAEFLNIEKNYLFNEFWKHLHTQFYYACELGTTISLHINEKRWQFSKFVVSHESFVDFVNIQQKQFKSPYMDTKLPEISF